MFRSLKSFVIIIFSLSFLSFFSVLLILWFFALDLPNYRFLENYKPPVSTKVYSASGNLIANFSTENRTFVSIDSIPKNVINAFLSAEDKNFFAHPGIDAKGITRAVFKNIKNFILNQRLEGASTITQQVAKNFLLTSDISFSRKIKEAILAFRIEKHLTKKRILELYLNEIYLGERSYGVAAASMTYFDKPLQELSIAESALLATLPKAPSTYNPYRNFSSTLKRKNWVLERMLENNFIEKDIYSFEVNRKIVLKKKLINLKKENSFYTEEVRRKLFSLYGNDVLYKNGLYVKTSLDEQLQKIASDALRKGLEQYDRRHGWRGPLINIENKNNWKKYLEKIQLDNFNNWDLAIVNEVDKNYASITTQSDVVGKIFLKNIAWARSYISADSLGPKIDDVNLVLKKNDIIYVNYNDSSKSWELKQIPKVNGSVIVLNPWNGNIYSNVGGYSFDLSKFNRTNQANRQPGSAFKPFVYALALENKFKPNTILLDAPFVSKNRGEETKWKPNNYGNKFYGLNTLRNGVEQSRNLMTVRLAQLIGNKKILDFSENLNIYKKPSNILSFSLGSDETTLLKLTAAYSIFPNGGFIVDPTMIDFIQNQDGKTIYKKKSYDCTDCNKISSETIQLPKIDSKNKKIISEETAFQISSILEGVVERGTGKKLKNLNIRLAGKTGTTNNNFDAWFVGFNPKLAIGVYIGFDEPQTLGKYETGARAALPIFQDIVENLPDKYNASFFKIPETINFFYADINTGSL
ncbi:MAG: PBP1A family penicillin-binding protein, partial [Proteobacteria bacterium]|nr:PBP1A family penicillin-binding protein [Pseudomonadota bacterium]